MTESHNYIETSLGKMLNVTFKSYNLATQNRSKLRKFLKNISNGDIKNSHSLSVF